MRPFPKVTTARLPLRKIASGQPPRRGYPAWIDSGEGAPFSALHSSPSPVHVTARVRDSLVLRAVASDKPRRTRHPFDAPGGR